MQDGHWFYSRGLAPFYTVWDKDGSTTGSNKPGFIVANNPSILPPAGVATCSFVSEWNAQVCPGVCFRTVHVMYNEPDFLPFNTSYQSGNRGDAR